MTDGWGISCEIALRWLSLDLTDDKSTLDQVMAWCRQATSHYLSLCWPRYLLSYGVTRPQWVNWLIHLLMGDVAVIWTWWHHKMETFSELLTLCVVNSLVTGEFPSQRPVTRSFDVFFELLRNKRLSKQSWRQWFETLSHSLWHHCNECGKMIENPNIILYFPETNST